MRRTRRHGLGLLLLTSLGSACTLPTEKAASTSPPAPRAAIEVLVGRSRSEVGDADRHLATIRTKVLPLAARLHAAILVNVLGDRSFAGAPPLVTGSYADVGRDAPGNPYVIAEDEQQVTAALMPAIDALVHGQVPSPASDVFGGFARVAADFAQYPRTTRRVLIVLGDAIDTTAGCVLRERQLDASHFPGILDGCTGGRPLDLTRVEIWMIGAGHAADGTVTDAFARALEPFYRFVAERSGARLVVFGTDLVAMPVSRRAPADS